MVNVKEYILPSNGLLGYRKKVNIRSMKGSELSTAYSSLTDASMNRIIQAVIEPEISSDLLCDEDKFFILHMTRVQTFGNVIQQALRCPFCGKTHNYSVDYNDLKVNYLENEEQVEGEKAFKLNDTEIIVKKKVPTNEDFTELSIYKDKHNPSPDDAFVLLMISRIKYIKVNDRKLTTIHELLNYLVNLDGLVFLDINDFIQTQFGLDTTFVVDCESCKTAITGGIGITADLFRNTNRTI